MSSFDPYPLTRLCISISTAEIIRERRRQSWTPPGPSVPSSNAVSLLFRTWGSFHNAASFQSISAAVALRAAVLNYWEDFLGMALRPRVCKARVHYSALPVDMLELDHRLAPDTPASLSTNQRRGIVPPLPVPWEHVIRSGLETCRSPSVRYCGSQVQRNGPPRDSDKLTALRERTEWGRRTVSLSRASVDVVTSACHSNGIYDFCAPLLLLKNTPRVFLFSPCFLNISLTHFPPSPPLSSHPDLSLSHTASAPSRFGRILALVIQKQLLHGAHSFRRKMSLSWLLSAPAKLTTLGPGLSLRVCEQCRGNWNGCHGGGGPARAPKSAPVEPDSGTLGMDCSLVLSRHFPGATTWRFPVLPQRLSDSDWMELLG